MAVIWMTKDLRDGIVFFSLKSWGVLSSNKGALCSKTKWRRLTKVARGYLITDIKEALFKLPTGSKAVQASHFLSFEDRYKIAWFNLVQTNRIESNHWGKYHTYSHIQLYYRFVKQKLTSFFEENWHILTKNNTLSVRAMVLHNQPVAFESSLRRLTRHFHKNNHPSLGAESGQKSARFEGNSREKYCTYWKSISSWRT